MFEIKAKFFYTHCVMNFNQGTRINDFNKIW